MKKNDSINEYSINLQNAINKSEKEEQNKFYILIKNYKNLVNVNIKILRLIIINTNNKSTAIYHLGFLIELFFKMILLDSGIQDIMGTCSLNHHVFNMYQMIMDYIQETTIKEACSNIMERASLICYSNGNRINLDEYANFRYNHRKNEMGLIFTEEINGNDKKHIEEVIECIKSIMK